MTSKLEKGIKWIVKNWNNIPDENKVLLKPKYIGSDEVIKNLPLEEHFVVLVLDRQKPSVVSSYDFDEERIGITRTGKVVWGFDSGCSCPMPWENSYPNCYNTSKTWKEFELNLKDFDKDWESVILSSIAKIKETEK